MFLPLHFRPYPSLSPLVPPSLDTPIGGPKAKKNRCAVQSYALHSQTLHKIHSTYDLHVTLRKVRGSPRIESWVP